MFVIVGRANCAAGLYNEWPSGLFFYYIILFFCPACDLGDILLILGHDTASEYTWAPFSRKTFFKHRPSSFNRYQKRFS